MNKKYTIIVGVALILVVTVLYFILGGSQTENIEGESEEQVEYVTE